MFSVLLPIIYISFISLGLPDSLLGCAWPTIYPQFGVPFSSAGIISMIISVGTVISSLMSDRLTARFGTGRVTAASVALTALALLGFSVSGSFWMLCALAVPYGLGAGSVDATLNNYVALHYASRHMSWLHCMWGIGATAGPFIMGLALSGGQGWHMGYRYVGLVQIVLSTGLFFSLPLWKKADAAAAGENGARRAPLALRDVVRIPGAREVMLGFFCYCAYEQTAILWGSSFLVGAVGLDAGRAAALGSLFCIGITAGRGLSGFVTYKLSDTGMIRLGEATAAIGALMMLLPLGAWCKMAGLIVFGLGCAPIYPSIIHSTPQHFGAERSQAVIGVQMASAYVGITVMPPVFGLIAQNISVRLMPVFVLFLLAVGAAMLERLNGICGKKLVK